MNSRTIRRAIERKAKKQIQKEAANTLCAAAGSFAEPLEIEADFTFDSDPVSGAQLAANRRNATLSTGPVTPEGKAKSSRNALKTGLTGRTVLLTSDDAALYEHHLQSYFTELQPVGDRETELAQSIADSKWRLGRIPSLEFGIYALGRIQFADEFPNLERAEAALLIEAKTHLAHQRQLNNLSIQECRLRRQCEKDAAELARLQQLRAETDRLATRQTAARATPENPPSRKNGFEFATADLDALDNLLPLDSELLHVPQAA